MKKLTRGYEATEEQLTVNFSGEIYNIANLKKSGIMLQNTIIIGRDDKWLEISCSDFGISNNIHEFKTALVVGAIKPAQIGIVIEKKVFDYHLKHQDFEKLETLFPAYPYYMISKLYRHITRFNRRSNYDDLKQFMQRVSESGKTIPEWIKDSENESEFFVYRDAEGKNHEEKITDGENKRLTFWIKKTPEGFVYDSEFYLEGKIYKKAGSGFETVRYAKAKCLSEAIMSLRTIIIDSQDKHPEQYYELFRRIQNKSKIINMNEKTKARESQLTELGLAYNPSDDSYVGHGFTATGNSIENDTDEDWQDLLDRIEGMIAENSLLESQSNAENFPNPPAAENTPPAPAPVEPTVDIAKRSELRLKEVVGLGYTYNDADKALNLNIPTVGFLSIALLDIQTYSDRKWTSVIMEAKKCIEKGAEKNPETPVKTDAPEPVSEGVAQAIQSIPEPPKPAGRALSITTIEGLEAGKISEFKDIEKETDKLIKANPIIAVTDKTTLEKAKKNRAAMLKACTAIDGKEGLAAITNKAFNTVKKTFSDFLSSAAERRRTHYNEQNTIIQEWENAEELRIAEEQRLKLQKIKDRTNELFAIPMVFNGTSYSIGAMYVMPSEIEIATNEDFSIIIARAKAIKMEMDAQASVQSEKDAQIAALQAQIAALTGNTAPAPESPKTVQEGAAMIDNIIPEDKPEPLVSPAAGPANPPAQVAPSEPRKEMPATFANASGYAYQTQYIEPSPKNDILHRLDMEHLSVISSDPVPPAFIKARAYFIRGTKEMAKAVNDILYDETPNALKKSERIAELCKIILEQK